MSKFHKIQKVASIIPYFSSFAVFAITMFQLKKKKASIRDWCIFFLIMFGSVAVVSFVDNVVMTGQNPILNIMVAGILLAIANSLCVDLQIKCSSKGEFDQNKPSDNKKRVCLGIIISVILVVIAVVAVILMHPSVDITDNNGDDTNLAVLSMDDLLSNSDKYSALGFKSTFCGNSTTVVGTLADLDRDVCEYRVKRISGVKTLHVTKTTNEELTLDVTSTLTSGNAEIIITVDGHYYQNIEINNTERIVLSDIAGKLVTVILGAESAELSVAINRT